MDSSQQLIDRIQEALRELHIPAWLLYGFHDRDPIALRILQFKADQLATRRWFYLIPAQGEPQKLVHRVETVMLDHLPGNKEIYLQWEQLQNGLKGLLKGVPRVAMQFSENNAIPYFSHVDAGTVDLIRSLNTEVISSGWSGIFVSIMCFPTLVSRCPMAPMVNLLPRVETLLARTKEPHHEAWFRKYVRRSVVAKQMLEEENVSAPRRQFDRIPQVEQRDILVEVVEVFLLYWV